MADNCIFCKIANGEIPSATLYEDEEFRVILDLGPASKGHALVLPKTHAADLFSLPAETAAKAIQVAKKAGEAIKNGLNADGLNVVQNNGEAAGQTVPHFHMHLIPRYQGDESMDRFIWKQTSPGDEELDGICDALKQRISGR